MAGSSFGKTGFVPLWNLVRSNDLFRTGTGCEPHYQKVEEN
jgi:hypothetical protein